MADCEKMATCPFINIQLTTMPALAAMMKQKYCQGDCTQCVRYRLEKLGVVVPMELFPDDERHAEKLFPRAS